MVAGPRLSVGPDSHEDHRFLMGGTCPSDRKSNSARNTTNDKVSAWNEPVSGTHRASRKIAARPPLSQSYLMAGSAARVCSESTRKRPARSVPFSDSPLQAVPSASQGTATTNAAFEASPTKITAPR